MFINFKTTTLQWQYHKLFYKNIKCNVCECKKANIKVAYKRIKIN